jgi:hypothetical protein
MQYALGQPNASAAAGGDDLDEMQVHCPGCRARLSVSADVRRRSAAVRCPACRQSVPLVAQTANPVVPASEPVQQSPRRLGTWPAVAAAASSGIGFAVVALALVAFNRSGANVAHPPLATAVQPPQSADGAAVGKFFEAQVEQLSRKVESQSEKIDQLQRTIDTQKSDVERLQQVNRELQEKVAFTDRWRRATFLVTDHNNHAAAIGVNAAGGLEVLAKAEHPWVAYADKVAYKFRIPRFDRDPGLVRKLVAQAPLHQSLEERLDVELRRHWRVHKYVPPGPEEAPQLVSFYDILQKRQRLGFYVAADSNGLTYHPVGGAAEIIPRSRIEPGTALKAAPGDLKLEPTTDFLDFCALSIAQNLGTPENSPRLVTLAVDVSVDTLEEFLELSKQPDTSSNDIFFDFLARIRREPYRPDARKAHARSLRDAARELHDELVSRLSKFGIPLVEREEVDRLLAERKLAKHEEFEPHEFTRMLCATHLVIAEVDKPMADGKLRLSVRLDEVDTGRNLWADNCDLGRSQPADVAAFLLDSGEPALVAFAGAPASGSAPGPLPLVLPPLAADPAGQTPRLGYIEAGALGEPVLFRDLFRHELVPLSAGMVKDIKLNPNLQRAPRDQRLRHLTWELARGLLPSAGRVTSITDNRAAVTIGRGAGIDVGSRLKVWRVAGNFSDQSPDIDHWRVLPQEVVTAEVNQTQAKVFIPKSGLEQLWPDAALMVGDLVALKDAPAPSVAVMPLALDDALLGMEFARKFAVAPPAVKDRVLAETRRSGERLRDQIQAAMGKLNVRCVDPARPSLVSVDSSAGGASYVISGSICPNSLYAEDLGLAVSVHVTDARRGNIVLTLPNFALTANQIDRWLP